MCIYGIYHIHNNTQALVVLGGLVVSVLAAGPKVRGFKPGRRQWILRVTKVGNTPLFGREVNLSALCRRFTAC
jgi:hypothetical protein